MSGNETSKMLTPAQVKALEALITHGNVAEAARSARVGRATVYRWLKDEAFSSALDDASEQALQQLSRNLARLTEKAAAALDDALDKSQKITVRLRAAELVTDRALRVRELVDVEQRLAELEGLE